MPELSPLGSGGTMLWSPEGFGTSLPPEEPDVSGVLPQAASSMVRLSSRLTAAMPSFAVFFFMVSRSYLFFGMYRIVPFIPLPAG